MNKIITITTLLLVHSLLLTKEFELQQLALKSRTSSFKSVHKLTPESTEEQNEQPQKEDDFRHRLPFITPHSTHTLQNLDDTESEHTQELVLKQGEQEEIEVNHPLEHTQEASYLSDSQTRTLIHERSLALITGDSQEIRDLLTSPLMEENPDLQNALVMHQRLCELNTFHQNPKSLIEHLTPYGVATGIVTAGYYFLTSPQTKKVRASLPVTPFIVIGASVAGLMYLRSWLNEDKFKALDNLKEASNLAIKTAQELEIIKKELIEIKKMNKELMKKTEPFEKTTREILVDIEKIAKISNEHVRLAQLQEYTLQLAVYNAKKYNKLVHKLIQQSEQSNFLIIELEENTTHTVTQNITASTHTPIPAQVSATQADHDLDDDNEILTHPASDDKKPELFTQEELIKQHDIVEAYCKKHSWNILNCKHIRAEEKISVSRAYYAVPQEWRKKHYKAFEDSLELQPAQPTKTLDTKSTL